MKTKLIPFSIEYYNAHPDCKVVYRNGDAARILATNLEDTHHIVASFDLKENILRSHTSEGRYWQSAGESKYDLLIQVPSTTRPFTPEELMPMIGKWLVREKHRVSHVWLMCMNSIYTDKAQREYEISPVGDGVNWQPMCKEVE